MGLEGYSEGVLAQEVLRKFPDAIEIVNGYLFVKYNVLDELVMKQKSINNDCNGFNTFGALLSAPSIHA